MKPLPPAVYSTLGLLAISSYLRHTFNIGLWLSKVKKHSLQKNSHTDGKGDPRSIQHKLILKFLIFKQVTIYISVPI